jgi:hypothetical protein
MGMAIDFEELEALATDGATAAMVIAHLRRKEAKRASKRERDKLRQRAIRGESPRHEATSRDVAEQDQPIVAEAIATTTPCADPPTKQTAAPNVPPHPPKDNNTPAAATGERASEKTNLISEQAFTLSVEIKGLVGVDPDDPGWYGTPYTVQAWLNGGASAEEIKFAVGRATARLRKAGRGPPNSASYFTKAVAEARFDIARMAKNPQQEMFLHVMEGGNASGNREAGGQARAVHRGRFDSGHGTLSARLRGLK